MSSPAREARKAAGFTVAEAARLLGYSVSHLGGLERGDAPWPYHKALRAARLYGVPMQVFSTTRAMRLREVKQRGRGRGVAASAPARRKQETSQAEAAQKAAA